MNRIEFLNRTWTRFDRRAPSTSAKADFVDRDTGDTKKLSQSDTPSRITPEATRAPMARQRGNRNER